MGRQIRLKSQKNYSDNMKMSNVNQFKQVINMELDTISIFRGELLGKRGVTFFSGRKCSFYLKKLRISLLLKDGMKLRMKNFDMMGVHWKIGFLWRTEGGAEGWVEGGGGGGALRLVDISPNGNLCFRVFKLQLKVINKNVCYLYSAWVNHIN